MAMRTFPFRSRAQPSGSVSAHLALAVLCLTLAACAGLDSRGDLPTVVAVDLSRYAGTWYEIARLFGSSREDNYWILDLDQEYRTARWWVVRIVDISGAWP